MRKVALIFIISALLVGCGDNEQVAISQAKKSIARMLKDPDSAKFEDVTLKISEESVDNQPIGYVCGYVNGKNAFGAYAGSVRFVAKTVLYKSGAIVMDAQMDTGEDKFVPGRLETPFEMTFWNPRCVIGYDPEKYKIEPADTEASNVKWSVMLASLSSRDRAEKIKGNVESIDIPSYIKERDGVNLVYAGPFDSRSIADSKAEEIDKKIKLHGFVIRFY